MKVRMPADPMDGVEVPKKHKQKMEDEMTTRGMKKVDASRGWRKKHRVK